MTSEKLRLARLSFPAKMLVTLFLFAVGAGYFVAMANIYLQHQDADLEPGLDVNDLRRTFHGMEKVVTPDAEITVNSVMLEQVRPGGDMREHLEPGGEQAVRGLIAWLEGGAEREAFAKAGLAEPNDPSAAAVLAAHCIECHNADGGDMEDVPFAATDQAEPKYALVLDASKPEFTRHEFGPKTLELRPTSVKRLVLVTHAHILTIPVFVLLVGALFLMTGFSPTVKLLIVPVPMLAVLLDVGAWWLARFCEPFIYVIAASGAVFGAAFGLQILGALCSMWFGRTDDTNA